MVAVKKVGRLKIADLALVLVAVLVADLVADLVAVLVAVLDAPILSISFYLLYPVCCYRMWLSLKRTQGCTSL